MKNTNDHKKIRIAFCGHRGHVDKFARMVNSYTESEAAGFWDDEQPEQAKQFAEQFACRYYGTYTDLVQDPGIDGVVISMTNNRNTELILQAVHAGKSMFVEKPLCMDPQDAYTIRRAVKEKNVKFFMTDPFVDPGIMWAKTMLSSRKLGKLLSVRCRFHNEMFHGIVKSEEHMRYLAETMGGGIMADTGNHPVHAVTYLLGIPERVYGSVGYLDETARSCGFDQFATVVYHYPEDVTATMEIGFVAPSVSNAFEIHGTGGSILYQGFAHKGDRELKYCLVKDVHENPEWITVKEEELPPQPDDHIRYYVRMLAEDIPNEQVGIDPASVHGVSLDTAVSMVELCKAFYDSAASGCAVKVQHEQ